MYKFTEVGTEVPKMPRLPRQDLDNPLRSASKQHLRSPQSEGHGFYCGLEDSMLFVRWQATVPGFEEFLAPGLSSESRVRAATSAVEGLSSYRRDVLRGFG